MHSNNHTHIHDVIGDVERKKERKKDIMTMEKWKWELPQVGHVHVSYSRICMLKGLPVIKVNGTCTCTK